MNEEENVKAFMLKAVFCLDKTFELEQLLIEFQDEDRQVTPALVKKTGDCGKGDGVYYFLEPTVTFKPNTKFKVVPKVSEKCVGKIYDLKMYIVTILDEEPKIIKET
jgi:hypothetical protein